ncbi:MAG TPA: alpha/beta hydrolase [Cytophagales bacterium]|nr:alpha/beta hydrolase [Cytophagales bacterium]HAA17242.1 alpha/beta hydrolase [Cytophagales bacterium]HAP60986.1 alpha/beta hydrolase [Cytophagales bacterium]
MKRLGTLLLLLFMSSQASHSQSWVNTQQYPFESKYLALEGGRMHYLDEGEGDVILFVHGTPTWSFLYRDFVRELSQNYRCIAIDHLGFGLSDKPAEVAATPQWHAQNLTAFIQALDLQDVTLVVHDFGAPIGLAAGIAQAHRIKRVVMFNTWLWATADEKRAQKINRMAHSGLGRFLYLNMNISPKVLLKQGFADKRHLTKAMHLQYLHPFPSKQSRVPLLDLAKALVGSSEWYQQQWLKLDALSTKDWLILWGTEDSFITTEYLQQWEQRLPQAEKVIYNCGHFVQEEKTAEAIVAIRTFMEK